MRLRRGSPAIALGLALVLSGCGRGDNPTVDVGGDTTTTTAASTVPTTSTPPSTGAPSVPPVSAPAPADRAYLTGVRAAASATAPGASRVVFEFDPGLPGYAIDYTTRPVTEDGSGAEVTVAGEAVLKVRMLNASGARFVGDKVVLTYTGPKRVTASGTGVVTEVVDTGDFEGQVTWVIGLRQKVPAITVTTLTGPSRLVIDVPAPAS